MKRMQLLTQLTRLIVLTLVLIHAVSTTVLAEDFTPLDISSSPLFLGTTVPPNMLIILDNSLSTDHDIMTKAHWERAAYESIYASGAEYAPTNKDIAGNQLATCSDPDGDCGILRQDGAITLSGPPDLGGHRNDDVNDYDNDGDYDERLSNYLPYLYLSSCRGPNETCNNNDDNFQRANCVGEIIPGIYSLADCPETEALDWRVRSAALNVLYYNPNINYKAWKFYDLPVDAAFTAVRRNPYSNQTGYNSKIDLSKTPPLGIDPTSCVSTASTKCKAASFSNGFIYYIGVDDKGYKKEDGRPRRGNKINMTDGPNGMVDLWDTRYKVTVKNDSMKVEKITCEKAYIEEGLLKRKLKCGTDPGFTTTDKIPVDLIPDRVSVNSGGPTLQEEQINIAYWYQFYRRRLFTLKGMITNMPYFAPNYRYGLMSLGLGQNQSNLLVASSNNMNPLDNLGRNVAHELIFEFPIPNSQTQSIDFQQHNQNIMKALFKLGYFGPTPMRETLNRAGKYYAYTGSNGNLLIPGTTVNPITEACQRNYSLVITDGYYTISGNSFTKIDGNAFTDEDGDGSAVTLADMARYYYKTDLRPSNEFPNILTPAACDNRPPESCNNCDKDQYYPTYQHMITFGISFGVDGKLQWGNENEDDGWPNSIVTPPIVCPPPPGTTNAWNKTAAPWADHPMNCTGDNNDCPQKLDDIWHAAYNSHGAYIPVKTPKEFEDALRKVLDLVSIDRAFASSASSSSYYEAGDRIFQTGFESQYWTGNLKAYTVDDSGHFTIGSQNTDWSAAEELNNNRYGNRNILSYNPVEHKAINFKWDELDWAYDALNRDEKGNIDNKGAARVEFLRGRGAGTGINRDDNFIGPEDKGGNNFRRRPSVLGDIIQSDPVYVGESSFRYDEYDCPECATYYAFKSNSSSRSQMVYVGANDGMLHGFDANTGEEIMAYVPARLVDKLSALTSRNYTHQYYVDGSATVGDAYINGHWRTVLVGSLRAGGQAVFAINITEPNKASVLWEFSDKDDSDLGYTFSKPVIARLHDNRWAAIFGNGYNNIESDGSIGTGAAVLYVVYLDNKTLEFKKLTTDPVVTDPTGANRPNGFATPAVVDVNIESNFAADYIYVGDLFGNLWKFDIRSSDFVNSKGKKLFEATIVADENSKIYQPITTRPVVSNHPALGRGNGYMIYFGTGKYFETGDNLYTRATQQSFYGIWDDDPKEDASSPPPITRADLYQQIITPIDANFRTLTPANNNQTIRWRGDDGKPYNRGWYIDFPLGEKQITNAAIWNKRVIFTTLVLPENPQSCDSDGSSSWLMVVNAKDGGALLEPTFDLNGDFKFDSTDLITTAGSGAENPAGIKSNVGALPALTLGLASPSDISNGDVNANTCDIPPPPPLCGSARGTSGGNFSECINSGTHSIGRQSWRQLWR